MNHQNFWPSLERVPINEENLNVKYEDVSMFDGVQRPGIDLVARDLSNQLNQIN